MNNDENKVLNDIIADNKKNEIEYDLVIEKLQKKFEIENDKLNSIIKEQEKNIIYLKSDIENIKRNGLKEIQNSVNRQTSKIISIFLSVFDDYQRSIEYAEKYENKMLPSIDDDSVTKVINNAIKLFSLGYELITVRKRSKWERHLTARHPDRECNLKYRRSKSGNIILA